MFNINSPNRQHLPEHDLESFFYVIVIITMLYEGPGVKKGPSYWKAENVDLAEWWNVQNWEKSARTKSTIMASTAYQWEVNVAFHISDYFKCWKDCINDLRSAIFGHMELRKTKSSTEYTNSEPITYDAMIIILEKMVELGAAEDELSNGDALHHNQEEWKDYHAFESLDGNQIPGATGWEFPKVETFRIMDAIERTVAAVPATGDGHFGSSDIPADEYSADPYVGGGPGANDIPKHHYDSSSIRTSDLPTSSGAITSYPSSTEMPPPSMPPPSMPPTSMAPTSSSSKRMEPASPLPPPNDNSDNGPRRKRQRQTQPSKQPPSKDKIISTSSPALLNGPTGTSHRAPNSSGRSTANSRGSRGNAPRRSRGSRGTHAPSRGSCRSGRDDDAEYVPPEAETPTEEQQTATWAFKHMKELDAE
jgi:hypothetical protein